MPESIKYAQSLNLYESWLCLDFANTIGWFIEQHSAQAFTYSHLLTWAKQAKVIDEQQAKSLEKEAQAHPKKAFQAVKKTLLLCLTTYRVFSAHAEGNQPKPEDLKRLNALLSQALKQAEVVSDHGEFVWSWNAKKIQLDMPLWPVAWSAAELLTSEDRHRIGQCASDECKWLFYDTSKNRSRRWCSMKMCGNVAKARRHYQRQKRAD